jgi:hypothetical protein
MFLFVHAEILDYDFDRAIEIKSTDHVETEHKKGLKKFAEEHPDAK